MENPTKIEIEGLKTIHKLCKFGADHNMEGCSFAEIVERMFDELQQAQKVTVPEPTKEVICAIENTVEDQLIASGITSDPFRLDGEKIYKAMIEAQEPTND